MSKQLLVNYEGKPAYNIILEKCFDTLKDNVDALNLSDRKALIVTDQNIAPLYLEEVEGILKNCFSYVDSVTLVPGEEHKNTDSIALIYEKLVEDSFDRNDVLIALGGGVVGDMTGFAAATYMRGIRFIQIPTTLLSQVDSSIGGKTGVDFKSYKNMVGAFHMPILVYSNISTLKTLDDIQYASGMGEVIKHALIKSTDYLRFLYDHEDDIMNRDEDVMIETVYASNVIKKEVVEIDPKEKGIRQILNFGHTLGHAIEKCSNFSYSHGQCVAFGCLAALHISDITDATENSSIISLMKKSGLETVVKCIPVADILSATKKDKKMDNGQVKFVLLKNIGEAYITYDVTDDMMSDAVKSIMETR